MNGTETTVSLNLQSRKLLNFIFKKTDSNLTSTTNDLKLPDKKIIAM